MMFRCLRNRTHQKTQGFCYESELKITKKCPSPVEEIRESSTTGVPTKMTGRNGKWQLYWLIHPPPSLIKAVLLSGIFFVDSVDLCFEQTRFLAATKYTSARIRHINCRSCFLHWQIFGRTMCTIALSPERTPV